MPRYEVEVKKTGFGGNIIAKNSNAAKKEFIRISIKEGIQQGVVKMSELSAKKIKVFK